VAPDTDNNNGLDETDPPQNLFDVSGAAILLGLTVNEVQDLHSAQWLVAADASSVDACFTVQSLQNARQWLNTLGDSYELCMNLRKRATESRQLIDTDFQEAQRIWIEIRTECVQMCAILATATLPPFQSLTSYARGATNIPADAIDQKNRDESLRRFDNFLSFLAGDIRNTLPPSLQQRYTINFRTPVDVVDLAANAVAESARAASRSDDSKPDILPFRPKQSGPTAPETSESPNKKDLELIVNILYENNLCTLIENYNYRKQLSERGYDLTASQFMDELIRTNKLSTYQKELIMVKLRMRNDHNAAEVVTKQASSKQPSQQPPPLTDEKRARILAEFAERTRQELTAMFQIMINHNFCSVSQARAYGKTLKQGGYRMPPEPYLDMLVTNNRISRRDADIVLAELRQWRLANPAPQSPSIRIPYDGEFTVEEVPNSVGTPQGETSSTQSSNTQRVPYDGEFTVDGIRANGQSPAADFADVSFYPEDPTATTPCLDFLEGSKRFTPYQIAVWRARFPRLIEAKALLRVLVQEGAVASSDESDLFHSYQNPQQYDGQIFDIFEMPSAPLELDNPSPQESSRPQQPLDPKSRFAASLIQGDTLADLYNSITGDESPKIDSRKAPPPPEPQKPLEEAEKFIAFLEGINVLTQGEAYNTRLQYGAVQNDICKTILQVLVNQDTITRDFAIKIWQRYKAYVSG